MPGTFAFVIVADFSGAGSKFYWSYSQGTTGDQFYCVVKLFNRSIALPVCKTKLRSVRIKKRMDEFYSATSLSDIFKFRFNSVKRFQV
jgi:hypothetical protein